MIATKKKNGVNELWSIYECNGRAVIADAYCLVSKREDLLCCARWSSEFNPHAFLFSVCAVAALVAIVMLGELTMMCACVCLDLSVTDFLRRPTMAFI